jgi:hypothetical protein
MSTGTLDPNLPTENISRLEQLKFQKDLNNIDSVIVKTSSYNGLLSNIQFDYISATYPDNKTEKYEYFLGGLSGTLKATIIIIYSDASKNNLVSVERL